MVQWLRLCASKAKGTGLSASWGTKIPHAMQQKKKKKKFKYKKINIRKFLI